MDISRLLHFIRTGVADPWHAARYHGGGKGGGAPAPDYSGAAREQAASSKEVTNMQTYANRPTVNTPFGSQTWETGTAVDPATGQPVTTWTQNMNLSPEAQASLDSQQRIQQGRSQAAETLLGQATEAFQTPFDWQNLPDSPGNISDAQQQAYQTMSAGLEPGRDRQRSALDTKLANMGLARGTEAFRNAQQDLADQFGQQDKGIMSAAMAEGRAGAQAQQALRGSAIAEQGQRRGMTLNELNALLTGQQVNMPTMPGFQNAQAAQGVQSLDAANMAFGADQANASAKAAGQAQTGQLVGTAAMVGAMMF